MSLADEWVEALRPLASRNDWAEEALFRLLVADDPEDMARFIAFEVDMTIEAIRRIAESLEH